MITSISTVFANIKAFYACFSILGLLSLGILFFVLYFLRTVRFRYLRWIVLICTFIILPFTMKTPASINFDDLKQTTNQKKCICDCKIKSFSEAVIKAEEIFNQYPKIGDVVRKKLIAACESKCK